MFSKVEEGHNQGNCDKSTNYLLGLSKLACLKLTQGKFSKVALCAAKDHMLGT